MGRKGKRKREFSGKSESYSEKNSVSSNPNSPNKNNRTYTGVTSGNITGVNSGDNMNSLSSTNMSSGSSSSSSVSFTNDMVEEILSGISDIKQTLSDVVGRIDRQDEKISTLDRKLSKLEKDINDPDNGVNGKLNSVIQEVNNHMCDTTLLQEQNTKSNNEMKLLRGYIIRLEQKLDTQQNQIIDLQNRSMKDNIVITGLIENDRENLNDKLQQIFREELGIGRAIPIDRIQSFNILNNTVIFLSKGCHIKFCFYFYNLS